jgi:SAM-dependent methyltransferase
MKSSILSSLVHGAGRGWRFANELCLGIATTEQRLSGLVPQIGATSSHHADNYAYSTPDYLDLRRILARLDMTQADVFYDIGCGMGRVVCLAARSPLTKVVGIELNPALAEIARRNAASLRGRRSPIEIRTEDAATAGVSNGTLYYLFNPFGPDTLRVVLANIELSLHRAPRAARFVYVNPQHKAVLDTTGWIEQYDATRTLRKLDVLFYRTTRRKQSERTSPRNTCN